MKSANGGAKSNGEKARRQSRVLGDAPLLRQVLDAMPNIVAVMNDERRVVFANKSLLQLLGMGDVNGIIGMRPGEALCCTHAEAAPDGCGSGEACAGCGLMLASQLALGGEACTRDALIPRREGLDELDLRIAATPLTVGEEQFTVLAVTDVGHEKRRDVLQRAFIEQVLGSAGRIQGFADMLRDAAPRQAADGGMVYSLAEKLAEESGRLRAVGK